MDTRHMADNLLLGPEAQVNHLTSLLRVTPGTGVLAEGARLAPGAFLSVDPEGQLTGQFKTGAGTVLDLSYEVQKPPRWLALHLELGALPLLDKAVFGIVCKSRAPQAATFRLCLRSAVQGGFVDAFFDKHVVAYADQSTHVDLLRLGARNDVPAEAPWRDLILFFQTRSAQIHLNDLRVFIA